MRALSLIFSLFLPLFGSLCDVSKIAQAHSYINCSEHIGIFKGEKKELSLEEILELSSAFEYNHKKSLGYVKGSVWSKLIIKSDTAQNLIFVNPKPYINYIDAYIFKDEIFLKSFKLGNVKQPTERFLHSKYSYFELFLEPGVEYEIFTRLQSRSVIDASYFVSTKEFFSTFMLYENMFWGIFMGLVVALIIYALSMLYVLRDFTYLAYGMHAIFALLFQLSTNGIFYQLGFYKDATIYNTMSWITAYLWIVSVLIFAMLFFDTKRSMKRIHKFLQIFCIIAFLPMLLFLVAFFIPDVVIPLRSFMKSYAIFLLFFLIIVGLNGYRKELKGASFYLAGHGIFLLALIYQQINGIISVEINLLNIYGVAVGFLLEIALLSLALNRKITLLKREKERSDALLLASSGFATIGKTIGNISHQLKVPIVHLGTLITKIESTLLKEKIESYSLQVTKEKMRTVLEFMQGSIVELNRFYSNINTKEHYNPSLEIINIIEMLSAKSAYIGAIIFRDLDDKIELEGYKNAFSNVILVLVDNALDVFKERGVKNGTIEIRLYKKDTSFVCVDIIDNGGGVLQKPKEMIFELLESGKKDGSGLGLTMSKILVEERLCGSIEIYNIDKGAFFRVLIAL